ncbi:MAG: hypothetical protein O3B27_05330 [Actinomycetota bacterium]|nr:hypothetical protein [Actinomycetota bacterium]MDA2949501.1 hypothetical protein [Actinomycetota bacterium]MDA2990963.1 hypothetical protein [Actinomycetota bacterium]
MPDWISLDEFVDGLDADRRTVEFLAPALSFESEPTSGDDVLGMFWRAYLMLQDADGLVGDPSIMVGQVDFILVPAGSAFASDQLRLTAALRPWQVDRFAGLFPGPDVDSGVDPWGTVELVLGIVDVVVDSALRGNKLGLWAVAQTVATMLPFSSGLVAMYPHWEAEANTAVSVEAAERVERFNRYWANAGLHPLPGHPQILGALTASSTLSEAYAAIQEEFYGHDAPSIELPVSRFEWGS